MEAPNEMNKPTIALHHGTIEGTTTALMELLMSSTDVHVTNRTEVEETLEAIFITILKVECLKNRVLLTVPEDPPFEAILEEHHGDAVQPRRNAAEVTARIDYNEVVQVLQRMIDSLKAQKCLETHAALEVAGALADVLCLIIMAGFDAARIPLTVDNESAALAMVGPAVRNGRDGRISMN